MSSMQRTIEGEVLVNHLTNEDWMIDQDLLARHGRTARTLVKEGPVRLTVMEIGAGGELPPHSTTSPVTIHVLEGSVSFKAAGSDYPLSSGDVLMIASGVEHSATSASGGKFLLTVFHPPSAGTPDAVRQNSL